MIVRARLIRPLVGSVLLAAALLLFARCDLMEPTEERQLVVEAFFVSEEPLGPIMLRTTRPLAASEADDTAAATGAEVTLELDGQHVTYRPVDGAPGRYAPDTSVTVATGDSFTLTARWEGQTATASGTVPRPIVIEETQVAVPDTPVEAILVDSLRRDSLDIPAEQGFIYPIEVTVSWAADFPEVGPDSAYWMRTQLRPYESVESGSRVVNFFLQPEEVFRERAVHRSGDRRQWTGVYAVPVEEEDEPLPSHELRVALIRGDSAYAAFATSRSDPERREPISNVRGAVGIATAIALDSVRVQVGADGVVP